MASQLQPRDQDLMARLRALRESRDFFQTHMGQWQQGGKHFVVLHRATIVGEGETAEAAWAEAKANAKHSVAECLLVHVPKKGESYFF